MTSEPAIAGERRLHPAGIAVVAVRNLRSVVVVAVAVVAGMGPARGIPLVVAMVLLAGVGGYLEWRATRYAVVDGGLRFRSGVLSRRELTVPRSRISALDTSRGMLQRVFGVVALEVQTAGGSERAELVLGAVRPAEAERLRRELGHRAPAAATDPAATTTEPPALERQAGDDEGAAPLAAPRFHNPHAADPDEAEVIYTVTVRQLLLAGLTSPSAALIGAGFAAVAGPAQRLLGDSVATQVQRDVERVLTSAPVLIATIAGLLALTLVVSVIGTVLTYHGFRLTRDARRLRLRRGLLTERTGTVPVNRIHAVRIVEQPLRQALGFVSIEAEVAGWATQDETVRTLVPFVRRDELPGLLPRLVPGFAWPEEALTPLPSRASRRYVWPLLWVAAAVAVLLVLAPWGPWRLGVAIAVALLAVGLGALRAHDAGWAVDGDRLVLRSRMFSRTTVIALTPRLQMRVVSKTPFQARAALATFGVRLSSRRHVSIRHIEAADAAQLLARLSPRSHERAAVSGAPGVA